MPRGKKKLKAPEMPPQDDVLAVVVPTEEQKADMVKLVDELAASKLCSHRNMHAQGDVACILPKDHKGDHSDGKSAWSDAAGKPVRKHG